MLHFGQTVGPLNSPTLLEPGKATLERLLQQKDFSHHKHHLNVALSNQPHLEAIPTKFHVSTITRSKILISSGWGNEYEINTVPLNKPY